MLAFIYSFDKMKIESSNIGIYLKKSDFINIKAPNNLNHFRIYL